jgi:nicotinate-nucleotide--dimethylbenzimidazole phosphoribosyltransferase
MAEKAILTGFQHATDLFQKDIEILGTGDMGIGNTTPSAAIGAVITGADLDAMVGPGTGVDDEGLERKRQAIRRGIELNQPKSNEGLDVLSKVGGFEIGAICGCILAGAFQGRPVVIDGFISTAGALIAYTLCPTVVDYIFSGHCSEEPGHRAMLNYLNLEPILDLGMRLGVKVFKEVLTFSEAGVADKEG